MIAIKRGGVKQNLFFVLGAAGFIQVPDYYELRTMSYELLMLKVPLAGKYHRDTGIVGGGDDFIVFL